MNEMTATEVLASRRSMQSTLNAMNERFRKERNDFDRIYVCLARTGDQLILLPLLYADAQAGLSVALVTHKDYSGLLDGVSYATEIIYDGDILDIDSAVKLAETQSKDVRVVPFVGRGIEINASLLMTQIYYRRAGVDPPMPVLDSFAKEIFRVVGRIKDFQRNLPLVFDRRSPERELALIQSLYPGKPISRNRKYILVSAGGNSAPFPYRDLLFELIRNRFCGSLTFKATIIDIGILKGEHVYDLLGLYERAVCLVSCDSAPLQLAYACPQLPVCALINDKPNQTFGSVWRRNHISHIRYSDFPKRAVEMLDAIARINKPGSILPTLVKGCKLIHCYSAYELNGEHAAAKVTWEREYLTGRWIATPIELGAVGRDSKTVLKDEKRYPFLKDVVRLATQRANDDDLIVLTRDYTCFVEGLTKNLTGDNPWYSHRRLRDPETHHPAVDLFCFSKRWWTMNRDEVPDLILGRDKFWDRVLLEILKRHGGKELPVAVYRNQPK